MTIYRIRHPEPAFTGFCGGVDFFNGQGSTSSAGTILDLLDLKRGFRLFGLTPEEKQAFLDFRTARRRALAKAREWREKIEAFERKPEYTALKLARNEQLAREKKEHERHSHNLRRYL